MDEASLAAYPSMTTRLDGHGKLDGLSCTLQVLKGFQPDNESYTTHGRCMRIMRTVNIAKS